MLANPIAELAEDNVGKTTELLWLDLLLKRKLCSEKGWRILCHILAAKHPAPESPLAAVNPDKREGLLLQALSACATILLELGGMAMPAVLLDRIAFSRAEDGSVPSEEEPGKKGALCVNFRSEAGNPPGIPRPIRLSLNELFVLAGSARTARCHDLRKSLRNLAWSAQSVRPKGNFAFLKRLISEPRTYAQLCEICQ